MDRFRTQRYNQEKKKKKEKKDFASSRSVPFGSDKKKSNETFLEFCTKVHQNGGQCREIKSNAGFSRTGPAGPGRKGNHILHRTQI